MITIRQATQSDAKEIREIYSPYVLNTAITFEYDVPSIQEFEQRITNTLINYPYLVAMQDDKVVGYAYTSSFKNRAAYDWSVETSIYVSINYRGKGIGKELYQKLENISKLQNVLNMNACIAVPDEGSVSFHERLGYKQVGCFHHCGYKLNRWYDTVWMEKMLGEHIINPLPFILFSKLDYLIY